MIHLIGPGGAGKSAVAPLVAALLSCSVLDLDRLFEAQHGSIDDFIASQGYPSYAAANVKVYCAAATNARAVIVLSSGFMFYPPTIDPRISKIQQAVATAATSVALIPSLDLEISVAEIVRRQAGRGFSRPRTPQREALVARERLAYYLSLSIRRITTMRPAPVIAREIAAHIAQTEADQKVSAAAL